jgi:rod shape-determining protein MreC
MEEDLISRRRSNFTFLLLLAVTIFFLTAHLTGYVRGLKNFLFYILYPTPAAASRVIQLEQQTSENLKEIVRIHQENLMLKGVLEKYAFLDIEWKRAQEENIRLRQLVNFSTPAAKESIVARVITREPGSWFQWVTIDRGSAEGLFVDAPVLAWAGERPAVLGRVGEVYTHTAKVILITNILSALPVQIRSISEDGLLEGQNSGYLKANYLLPEGNLMIGDEIVTSPLSAVFPSGIAIGTIVDLSPAAHEAFRSATVKPAVNLNKLREVIILVPNGSERRAVQSDQGSEKDVTSEEGIR